MYEDAGIYEGYSYRVIHLIHISWIVRSSFYECNLNVLLSSHIFHLSFAVVQFSYISRSPQTMEENNIRAHPFTKAENLREPHDSEGVEVSRAIWKMCLGQISWWFLQDFGVCKKKMFQT